MAIADSLKNPIGNQFTFKKFHKNTKDLYAEIDSIQLRLEKIGYLNHNLDSVSNIDSIYTAHFLLGNHFKKIRIYYDVAFLSRKELFLFTKIVNDNYFEIDIENVSTILTELSAYLANKGRPFTKLKLSKINITENHLTSELIIETSRNRKLDKVIINGYSEFPKTFLKHHFNLKGAPSFSTNKIEELSRSIKSLSFVSESKPSEILFSKDSTYLYVYLKKERASKFDGLVGFTSQENSDKLTFNGYLDLALNNILNTGERISLHWKNNGNDRQFFNFNIHLPYLFNTPFTPSLELDIYKQDSTFINTKTNFNIAYNIDYQNNIRLIYESENSNNLLETPSEEIPDYESEFIGVGYDFSKPDERSLFSEKFGISLSAMTGTRKGTNQNSTQTKMNLVTKYLWNLNFRNHVFIKNSSSVLFSDTYFTNELFRIGGINSIRGFNEESLFTSSHTFFNLEYRYLLESDTYIYTISDFGFISNELSNLSESIYGLGLGYTVTSSFGRIDLSYAIGKTENQPLNFDNSRFHIKIVTLF